MSEIPEETETAASGLDDRRQRIPTHKGFQNSLVNKTSAFNKQTKILQEAIGSVHAAIGEGGEQSVLKNAVISLEISKQTFESSFRNLEHLFIQDRWDETVDVEAVVRETTQKYLQHAEAALLQATDKLSPAANRDELSLKGSRRSRHSSRFSSSHASSTSARIKALAEAAAAREQAEYDVLIADKENERKQREAEDERERTAARAQHDHDMAVLTARKLTAVAEAKLDAIEQSILEERLSSPSTSEEKTSIKSNERTETWVQKQQQSVVPEIKRTGAKKIGVRFSVEEPRNVVPETNRTANQLRSESSSVRNEVHNPGSIVQECMGAVAATNDKLTSSLARINLPKCHPDLFSGDATMFHPWKSAFEGMIRDSDVTAEQEMNYLHMYTSGQPQKLVNSFRKRQHGNSWMLLKELWIELEKHFGNVAIITNTFLVRLKESAKFGEKEKKKLQTFSDLCTDVASQVDQLPGLVCLNYPNTIRPILYNLPASICSKWEKQV